MAPVAAVALGFASVRTLGLTGGACATIAGVVALRLAVRLGPLPPPPLDPAAGSSRRAVALGGPAPG